MCQNISQKRVKTRKPHRCFGCMRQVPIGTMIQRTVSAEDGRASSAYWCDICCDSMDNDSGGDNCYMEGELAPGVDAAGLSLDEPVVQLQ